MTTSTITLPPGVQSIPVSSNRYSGSRQGWPSRNSLIVFPDEQGRSDTLWRVAKVDSPSRSWPNIYLVPVHEVPDEGKDGTARVHYNGGVRTRYYQSDVGSLAKAGARIIVRNSPGADKFIVDTIAAQAEETRISAEREAAYKVAPGGGVADRLESVYKSVRYHANDRGVRLALASQARHIENELALVGDKLSSELANDSARLTKVVETLATLSITLNGISNHMETVVEMLRKDMP
jgi:hypothetical protein